MRDDLTGRARVLVARDAGKFAPMAADDQLDIDGMLERFRERADAVQRRALPPVAGPERQQFLERAQLDFQDFAMLGDATWSFVDGVLTLTIDLRPT